MNTGPLAGLKVVEIAGIGPGPFAAMLLADLGANVLRIERPDGAAIMRALGLDSRKDVLNRGRSSIALDLKLPAAVELVLELVDGADALIEGFRPGVMEKLGLGPDACLARNRRLVYGRMTGWGQDGPLAQRAGHDINYIAMSGMLHTFARQGERPVPPNNLVGDMGGGGLLLAFGMLAAVLDARARGAGQVVDAAMFEGAALLGTGFYGLTAMGLYDERRPGEHFVDTGSHFYDVYGTSDGRYVAVGAMEPQFYAQLLAGLGLDPATLPKQMDRRSWPDMKRRFAEIFRTRTRDDWEQVFAQTDACVSPVLSPLEATRHRHASARASFATVAEVVQPAPAPRFSVTPPGTPRPPAAPGADADAALERWGFDPERIAALRRTGVLTGTESGSS